MPLFQSQLTNVLGLFGAFIAGGVVLLAFYIGSFTFLWLYFPIEVLTEQIYGKLPRFFRRGTVRRAVDVLIVHSAILCLFALNMIYTQVDLTHMLSAVHFYGNASVYSWPDIRILVHGHPNMTDSLNKLNVLLFIRTVSEYFAPCCLGPSVLVGIIGSFYDARDAKEASKK